MPICLLIVYGYFCSATAELSSCNRFYDPQNLNILGFIGYKLPMPALDYSLGANFSSEHDLVLLVIPFMPTSPPNSGWGLFLAPSIPG